VAEDANAERFAERLYAHRLPEQREKYRRYFKLGEGEYGEGDEFVGVRMGQVFALAKEFIEMPPDEIEKLLESPIHEVRAGGLSIMDKQARGARGRRKAAGRSCSTSTCSARTGSTTGTWSTWPARTSSAATSPTSRATSSTSWRARRPCGTAHRHRQHLLLHQAGRRGRHLPDR
jgi:DNA alkylation repair enzyme